MPFTTFPQMVSCMILDMVSKKSLWSWIWYLRSHTLHIYDFDMVSKIGVWWSTREAGQSEISENNFKQI